MKAWSSVMGAMAVMPNFSKAARSESGTSTKPGTKSRSKMVTTRRCAARLMYRRLSVLSMTTLSRLVVGESGVKLPPGIVSSSTVFCCGSMPSTSMTPARRAPISLKRPCVAASTTASRLLACDTCRWYCAITSAGSGLRWVGRVMWKAARVRPLTVGSSARPSSSSRPKISMFATLSGGGTLTKKRYTAPKSSAPTITTLSAVMKAVVSAPRRSKTRGRRKAYSAPHTTKVSSRPPSSAINAEPLPKRISALSSSAVCSTQKSARLAKAGRSAR